MLEGIFYYTSTEIYLSVHLEPRQKEKRRLGEIRVLNTRLDKRHSIDYLLYMT